MTPDQYVESVLAKYAVPHGPNSPAEQLGTTLAGPVRTWAGEQLNILEYSGSYAKETGVRGISDVHVFISLKSDTKETLKDLYEMLFSLAHQNGWSPRRQNVSVGVTVNGTRGDLVPGKIQAGHKNYHSLYVRKQDSWTQTNVTLHADSVRNSGRLKEIRAIKIWRLRHGTFEARYPQDKGEELTIVESPRSLLHLLMRLLKQLQSLATAPAIDYEAYLARFQGDRGVAQ